jgi:hypothetical protein
LVSTDGRVALLDVITPLTEAGYHCGVPSLPGYGWTDKPGAQGWGVRGSLARGR